MVLRRHRLVAHMSDPFVALFSIFLIVIVSVLNRYTVNGYVKWAIAGRSRTKLEAVKQSLAKDLELPEILQLDAIAADTR